MIDQFAYNAFIDRINGRERFTPLHPLEQYITPPLGAEYCVLGNTALNPRLFAVGLENEEEFWYKDVVGFPNDKIRELWVKVATVIADYKDHVESEGYLYSSPEFYSEMRGLYASILKRNTRNYQIYLHHIKQRVVSQINGNVQYINFNVPSSETEVFYPKIMRIDGRLIFCDYYSQDFIKTDRIYLPVIKNIINISEEVIKLYERV